MPKIPRTVTDIAPENVPAGTRRGRARFVLPKPGTFDRAIIDPPDAYESEENLARRRRGYTRT